MEYIIKFFFSILQVIEFKKNNRKELKKHYSFNFSLKKILIQRDRWASQNNKQKSRLTPWWKNPIFKYEDVKINVIE